MQHISPLPCLCALVATLFFTFHANSASVDIVVTVSNEDTFVIPGLNVEYTVTVTNLGPSDSSDVTIEAASNIGGVEILEWEVDSLSTGASADASDSGVQTIGFSDTVDLDVNASVVYLVRARVDNASGETASVFAVDVTPDSGDLDSDDTSNSASDIDAIVLSEDFVTQINPDMINAADEPNEGADDSATLSVNGVTFFTADEVTSSSFDNGIPEIHSAAIGQPFAKLVSTTADRNSILGDTLQQLYYQEGAGPDENNESAFAFLYRLFSASEGGVVAEIERRIDQGFVYDSEVDPSNDDEIDGVSDEEIAQRVTNDMQALLALYPNDRELRNVVLDIYYYRTLGRQIVAKQLVVDAYQSNFSRVVDADVAFGTPIDDEIAAYTEAAAELKTVLNPYIELLMDDFGIDLKADVDSGADSSMPYGLYLFREEVPSRSVYAPTFVNFDPDDGSFTDTSAPENPLRDDSPSPAVLYVESSIFRFDEDGKTEVDESSFTTFSISNLGGDDLNWNATVIGDAAGANKDILEIRESGTSKWGTSLDSSDLSVLGAGESFAIDVRVAPNNSSPIQRSARVRVSDTSAGKNALTYDVVISQGGASGPILSVTANAPLFLHGAPQARVEEFVVTIENRGTDTLHWLARIKNETYESGDIRFDTFERLTMRGEASSSEFSQNDIRGTGTDSIVMRIDSSRGAPAGKYTVLQVWPTSGPNGPRIDADNPREVVVTIFDTVNTAKTNSASMPLLTLSNTSIQKPSSATTAQFEVKSLDAVGTPIVTTLTPWISVSNISEAGQVTLDIEENSAPTPRTGFVNVRATNTGAQVITLTVTQDGSLIGGYSVNPSQRFIDSDNGSSDSSTRTNEFSVQATSDSFDWVAGVAVGNEWLSIQSGSESGTGDDTIDFEYTENFATYARTGIIYVRPASATDSSGDILVKVVQEGTVAATSLSDGYKDFLLLFDVMRDDAQVNKELAKRYALRRVGDDVETAYDLIATTIRRHTAAIGDLENLIPAWRDDVATNSQLVATYLGWQQAITELSTVTDFLNGDTNILGFQESFLFLVQQLNGQGGPYFDTFDKLKNYISYDVNPSAPTSPIGYAAEAYRIAQQDYAKFDMTLDELEAQYRTQNYEHRKWMYDYVGVDPGNDVDNPNDPEAYNNPSGNFGGGIWLVDRDIERARAAIEVNSGEVNRIKDDINTELWRRAQEAKINATIADLQLAYGRQVAEIEKILGIISGAQELANNLTEAGSQGADEVLLGDAASAGVARTVNGVFQFAAEATKGALEAAKARLAAQESAQIVMLEDRINQANSEALIANMMGELNIVALQSVELGLVLIQELANRQALIDEWGYRENQMRENNAALLGRSFANPIHRQRMQSSMLVAEQAFKSAQYWTFMTIRAFEYKWNTPFLYTPQSSTTTWSMDSVFRSRTYKDLQKLLNGLYEYDGLLSGSAIREERFDWFSFKDDFLALTSTYTNGVEDAIYEDASGTKRTGTYMFQQYLKSNYDAGSGVITLKFDTVRDNGLTFYRGPQRDDEGNVITPGEYLDKIQWMKLNLVGTFTVSGNNDRVAGTLSYSGTSFVRNANPGTVDPGNSTKIVNEVSTWPTRRWYYDSGIAHLDPSEPPGGWRSSDRLLTVVTMGLSATPLVDRPSEVDKIDAFAERSVACDGWELRIETKNLSNGELVLDYTEIEDIQIFFNHWSVGRNATKVIDGAKELYHD